MIGKDAGVPVRLVRVAALQQNIFFGARHKERRAQNEHIQAPEIDLASIRDVERASFGENCVEHCYIRYFAVCNPNNVGIFPWRSSSVCILTLTAPLC